MIESDFNLDVGLTLGLFPEEVGGPPSVLRATFHLSNKDEAPEIWVLIDGAGGVVSKGTGVPAPGIIELALRDYGYKSPVDTLMGFLKRNPDHLEARRDLISAHARRAKIRLGRHPLEQGKDLSAELDELIWGGLSRELDALFLRDGWVLLGGNPLQSLPMFTPQPGQRGSGAKDGRANGGLTEARSPLMRQFASKHWPAVLSVLRKMPESSDGWLTLMALSSILGEAAPPFPMDAFCPYVSPFRNLRQLDAISLGRQMQSDARRTGRWREAVPPLEVLWSKSMAPFLLSDDVFRVGRSRREPTKHEIQASQLENRIEAWNALLAPLIEGFVRLGREMEVSNLLGDLDESWSFLASGQEFKWIALRLGRPELVERWRRALMLHPMKSKSLRFNSGGLRILYFGLRLEGPEKIKLQLQCQEVGLGECLEATPAQMDQFHWSEKAAGWAALDIDGRVLTEGPGPVVPTEVREKLIAKGHPTERSHAEDYLRVHPDRLMVKARLAGLHYESLRAIIERRRLERQVDGNSVALLRAGAPKTEVDSPNTAEPNLSPLEVESKACSDYFDLVLGLLSDPLGTAPEILRLYQPGIIHPDDLLPGGSFQAFAYRALSLVEGQLARRPEDEGLWQIWCVLISWAQRSPEGILASIQPSPITRAGTWPPIGALGWMAFRLAESEQWGTVITLLEPRWVEHLARKALEKAGPGLVRSVGESWDRRLARPLIEALLRSGRPEEATRVLMDQPKEERSQFRDLANLDAGFERAIGEAL